MFQGSMDYFEFGAGSEQSYETSNGKPLNSGFWFLLAQIYFNGFSGYKNSRDGS